jgi:hypothetical protein
MTNSFDSYPNHDADISKRMTQRLREGKIDQQILEILQQGFEEELGKERIILSRPEKARLFRQSIQAILTDLLTEIDSDH